MCAESLQSCMTLGDSMDYIAPGSSVHGIFQARMELVSVTHLCPASCNPWAGALQASLFFTISQSLLKLMSIKSVMPSNHLILCCPLLLLPSIFPSIKVFSNESVLCIRCPKYGSFSFSISPSNEYSGLISFRIDWFDCLAKPLSFPHCSPAMLTLCLCLERISSL